MRNLHENDDTLKNPSRRSAMACVGWIGTGMVFTMVGGVPRTVGAIGTAEAAGAGGSPLCK